MRTHRILGNIPLACAALGAMAAGQAPSPLSLTARIPLPNVTGRMDHLAADGKGQRLFVSALGNHTAEVLDLKTGRRMRSLTDLDEPQGEYYDPSTNRLFIATDDGAARIYDGSSLQLLRTVKLSDDADNVRYDGRTRSVVIGYGGEKALRGRPAGSGALAFFDAGGEQVKEIVVDAHPESFQLEKSGTRIFINVPDSSMYLRKRMSIITTGSRVIPRLRVRAPGSLSPNGKDSSPRCRIAGSKLPKSLCTMRTRNVCAAKRRAHSDGA